MSEKLSNCHPGLNLDNTKTNNGYMCMLVQNIPKHKYYYKHSVCASQREQKNNYSIIIVS